MTATIKCKLLAKEYDILDYHTLVFKNLENNCPFGHAYVMTTVSPNWQSKIPEINDVGYLTYEEVTAGDNYYSRSTQTIMKYNYSNIYFIKFVKEQDNSKKDIII